jgi:hypothetical protein
MRRILLALTVAALPVLWLTPSLHAQGNKSSRGRLLAMSADTITVMIGATEVKFAVDSNTAVEAPGAGTKTRAAVAANKPGLKLSDILKVGDAVEVTFIPGGSPAHADRLRKVTSPGAGGVPANRASGTVKAISATSMTIDGSGGGGSTYSQSFAIDDSTSVIGRGASHASAASAGRIAATEVVKVGDKVSVDFKDAGGTLRASEIRVTSSGGR